MIAMRLEGIDTHGMHRFLVDPRITNEPLLLPAISLDQVSSVVGTSSGKYVRFGRGDGFKTSTSVRFFPTAVRTRWNEER